MTIIMSDLPDAKKLDGMNNEGMGQFLSSMSFANKSCDCDDCGLSCEAPPESIAKAVQEHKRIKLLIESNPLQTRKLVCRDNCGVSIWKWTMPMSAKPLIEFGSSDRIILIHELRKVRTVLISL